MISFLLSILFAFLSAKSAQLTPFSNFSVEDDAVQNVFVFSTTYSHLSNNAGYRMLLDSLKKSEKKILNNITENIKNVLKGDNMSNAILGIGELTNYTSFGFHVEVKPIYGPILGTITHADFSVSVNGKKKTIPNIKIIVVATLHQSKKNWIVKEEGGNSSLSWDNLLDIFGNSRYELDSINNIDYGKSGIVNGTNSKLIYNEILEKNISYPKEYIVSSLSPSILDTIDSGFEKYWRIITIGMIIAVVIVIIAILFCLYNSKEQPLINNDGGNNKNGEKSKSRSPTEHRSTSQSRSASRSRSASLK